MNADDVRFGFGRNWKAYVEKRLSEERVETSRKHMLEFLGMDDLQGRSFLDIGCGSGLHSLAAFRSGAREIFAFDYDADSVAASVLCHRYAGSPPNWSIVQGSVLDEAFMAGVPQADIVYSWGVLHHTGDVWRAIRNAASRVPVAGLFYIALYSADVQRPPYTAEFWLDTKKQYVRAGWWGRHRLEWWYIWNFYLGRDVRQLPAFIRRVVDYRNHRGMDIMADLRDWLGGWPMQFVYDADAIKYCEGLGMRLERIKTGEANTEFLFRRVREQESALKLDRRAGRPD
jgi:2-polyprenyl-6-hydroxyphenyl methylase/3-demethylubiquinone-9 3-methyltransferase